MSGVITCCNCGIQFTMPELLRQRRSDDGGDFHCPNGHANVYRSTELTQEREARVKAESRAANAERALEAERRNHRAELKRLAKRRGEPVVRLLPPAKVSK
jgi:hypothetical protein